MRQWVKFYLEALHDRKMRRLDRFDKSVFYDLLLLAGQEDMDGKLPNIDDIAFELDLKLNIAKKSISKLIEIGVVSVDDDNNLCVTKFEKRQTECSTGYERVKRYREKKKNADNATNDNGMITHDNVTCNTQMITPDKDKEEDKDIDIEKDTEEDNGKEKKKKKKENVGVANATSVSTSKKSRGNLKPYGVAQNVFLSDDEYQKLQDKLGKEATDKHIEALSLYMGQSEKNAKKYTNHYYTVLSWDKREQSEPSKGDRWDRAAEQVEAELQMTVNPEDFWGILKQEKQDDEVIDL